MLNKKEVNFVYPLIIIKFKNTKNDTSASRSLYTLAVKIKFKNTKNGIPNSIR